MAVLIIIVVVMIVAWLLFIRPQRAKQQQQRSMLENVGPGDEIVTAGGIYGTVRSVADDEVSLEIAPGVEVRVAKRAIGAVIPPEEEEEEEEEAEADEDDELDDETDEDELEGALGEQPAAVEPGVRSAAEDSAADARR